MKRFLFIALFCIFSVELFAAGTTYSRGQILYVSVKSVKAGKNVLVYGDKVIVDESTGKKTLVHLDGNSSVSGWVANGNLTKKKIVKKDNGSYVRASADEIALAGKGFSEAAENLFKNDNPDISFDVVDEMEEIEISEDELSEFIEEGHLCE